MNNIIKLEPYLKSAIWGGEKLKQMYDLHSDNNIAEAWCVSSNSNGESVVNSGVYSGEKFKQYLDETQSAFDLLIKYISAERDLSVQVHPNDDFATKFEGQKNGKAEFWYTIDAEPDSYVYCGFDKDMSKQEFMERVEEGSICETLHKIEVRAGDCIFVPPGVVHSICKGVTQFEVSQNSNLTYRVYDYKRVDASGKERELHIDKAMSVLNLNKNQTDKLLTKNQSVKCGVCRQLINCKFFKAVEWTIDGSIKFDAIECLAINIIRGEGSINEMPFKDGDSFFVERNTAFCVSGKCVLIFTSNGN